MYNRIASTAALALASTSLVAAQTHRTCDIPDCPVMSAFGSEQVTIDFTKGESDLFNASIGSTAVTYDGTNGAVFSIAKNTDAPTFSSTKYLFFGKVDVTVRAAKGAGIVTSLVLQSDDLDEIDWEWIGSDAQKNLVQTNYFSRGNASTYDRGANFNVDDALDTFHTYSLDWTKERLIWSIDGTAVRTLENTGQTGAYAFPQTPMQIKLGTWCGGCSKDEGTREWAGGEPNFDEGPFDGYYQSVVIQDYSNGVDGAKSYAWTDSTGTYESIKVSTSEASTTQGGATSGDNNSSDSTGSGTQSAPTTLSTASATAGGITLATGSASSNNTTSTGSTNSTSTGSGSTSQSSIASVSGSNKVLGANFALLGAAMFALFSL